MAATEHDPPLAPLAWGAAHLPLPGYWTQIVREEAGRVWRLCGLINPEGIQLRDGLACVTVLRRLEQRADVEIYYYPAWESGAPESPPGRHYFFIGRPALYVGSAAGRFAQSLGGFAHARFEEQQRDRSVIAVRYGDQRFRKAEVDEGYRRVERDYGVLMFRRMLDGGEEHWVVSLAGLTFAATWALAYVLADPDELAELSDQVVALLPVDCTARFDEAFEVCVRFDFDKQDWRNLANDPKFEFRVEVVTGGPDVFMRRGPVELVLSSTPGRPGVHLAGGNRRVPVAPRRAALLRELIESGDSGVPVDRLLDEYYLVPKGVSVQGTSGARATQKQIDKADGAVRKLVYDVNATIEKVAEGWRPIEKIDGCYVLQAKARIDVEGDD